MPTRKLLSRPHSDRHSSRLPCTVEESNKLNSTIAPPVSSLPRAPIPSQRITQCATANLNLCGSMQHPYVPPPSTSNPPRPFTNAPNGLKKFSFIILVQAVVFALQVAPLGFRVGRPLSAAL